MVQPWLKKTPLAHASTDVSVLKCGPPGPGRYKCGWVFERLRFPCRINRFGFGSSVLVGVCALAPPNPGCLVGVCALAPPVSVLLAFWGRNGPGAEKDVFEPLRLLLFARGPFLHFYPVSYRAVRSGL